MTARVIQNIARGLDTKYLTALKAVSREKLSFTWGAFHPACICGCQTEVPC